MASAASQRVSLAVFGNKPAFRRAAPRRPPEPAGQTGDPRTDRRCARSELAHQRRTACRGVRAARRGGSRRQTLRRRGQRNDRPGVGRPRPWFNRARSSFPPSRSSPRPMRWHGTTSRPSSATSTPSRIRSIRATPKNWSRPARRESWASISGDAPATSMRWPSWPLGRNLRSSSMRPMPSAAPTAGSSDRRFRIVRDLQLPRDQVRSLRRRGGHHDQRRPSGRAAAAVAQFRICRIRLRDGDRHERQDERAGRRRRANIARPHGDDRRRQPGELRGYRRGLAGVAGLKLIPFDPLEASNFQYVVSKSTNGRPGFLATSWSAVLSAENVLARRYFFPGCHRMDAYRSSAGSPVPSCR